MEKLIKQKLIERGFSKETLLNNRGLIGAVIDETKEAITVTRSCTELPNDSKIEKLVNHLENKFNKNGRNNTIS